MKKYFVLLVFVLLGLLFVSKFGYQSITASKKGMEVTCEECSGSGKVEGLPCIYCPQFEGKCPVCLGTGKRIGGCPICGGSGKMWLEKSRQ